MMSLSRGSKHKETYDLTENSTNTSCRTFSMSRTLVVVAISVSHCAYAAYAHTKYSDPVERYISQTSIDPGEAHIYRPLRSMMSTRPRPLNTFPLRWIVAMVIPDKDRQVIAISKVSARIVHDRFVMVT